MAKQKKEAQLDIKKLIKLGKERGFVTQEEILQVFPKPEEVIDEVDDLFIKLITEGIDVFETTAEEMEADNKTTTELEKELEGVISELKKALIKASLEKLSLEIRNAQEFGKMEIVESLNKRFRDLSVKLKNL